MEGKKTISDKENFCEKLGEKNMEEHGSMQTNHSEDDSAVWG